MSSERKKSIVLPSLLNRECTNVGRTGMFGNHMKWKKVLEYHALFVRKGDNYLQIPMLGGLYGKYTGDADKITPGVLRR